MVDANSGFSVVAACRGWLAWLLVVAACRGCLSGLFGGAVWRGWLAGLSGGAVWPVNPYKNWLVGHFF
tara:strand:- start:8781 stop:8984 length:204 start_codon:yes stop_codon:yes gene_type:complete